MHNFAKTCFVASRKVLISKVWHRSWDITHPQDASTIYFLFSNLWFCRNTNTEIFSDPDFIRLPWWFKALKPWVRTMWGPFLTFLSTFLFISTYIRLSPSEMQANRLSWLSKALTSRRQASPVTKVRLIHMRTSCRLLRFAVVHFRGQTAPRSMKSKEILMH